MHEYLAHSENDITGKPHFLRDHLKGTAILAESFGRTDHEKQILKFLGYFHDIGKYRSDFQRYIREGGMRGSVHHSKYGAHFGKLKKMSEAAFCIAGHHGGIPDASRLKNDLKEDEDAISNEIQNLSELFQNDTSEDISNLLPIFSNDGKSLLETETYIRFLFSCLVDSDWLDTEAHFSPETAEKRISRFIDEKYINNKISVLDRYITQFPDHGEMNLLRNDARKRTNNLAEMPRGFYSLNLPTGLGKTLCSVSWALRHAKFNGLKRIIIVLPYTSIIDQSAKLLKEIFGEQEILEHHSTFERKDGAVYSFEKLSAENWDFPFILTTTVQFFESVFSNKPSKCRKVHNIVDSVVIFDEVQTFPKDKFLPTVTMLKNLNKVFNTSFLFCTATQPAFASRDGFNGIDEITPLVTDPERYYAKTKRVEYALLHDLMGVGLDELVLEADRVNQSALLVFNTKKDTLDFYNMISSGYDEKYHLSTSMCPVHRKTKIASIKSALKNKKKRIIVSSTQLIEAGVDLDFPVVFRALAPLDSIIQSAGRCNREGALPDKGKVFIFKLLEHRYPEKTYELIASVTEIFLKRNGLDVLLHHDSYAKYFIELDNFLHWDKGNIDESREKLSFEEVADGYKIISSPAQTVVVRHGEGEDIINALIHKPLLSRDDYRKLQLYSIQIYPDQFKKSMELGLIEQSPNGQFFIWIGEYSNDVGIVFNTTNAIDCIV
ncbi:MAG: CRISPR-associated helicase Cas3' [Candidatus Auribacterota bacterium]